mmetsp:Transcript_27519/g.47693  ORF Transcript_27519/g.47693 Transcript_27519/m.47693 type:complete len:110 (-) Transcript_27519:627-956(-)
MHAYVRYLPILTSTIILILCMIRTIPPLSPSPPPKEQEDCMPPAIHEQDDGHAHLQLRHYFASSPSHRHYSPIARAAAPPSLMMASFHLVLVVRTLRSASIGVSSLRSP